MALKIVFPDRINDPEFAKPLPEQFGKYTAHIEPLGAKKEKSNVSTIVEIVAIVIIIVFLVVIGYICRVAFN